MDNTEFKLVGVANHGSEYVTKVDVWEDLVVSGDEGGVVRLYRIESRALDFVSEFKVQGRVVEVRWTEKAIRQKHTTPARLHAQLTPLLLVASLLTFVRLAVLLHGPRSSASRWGRRSVHQVGQLQLAPVRSSHPQRRRGKGVR